MKIKKFVNKFKLYFYYLTFERFPNIFRPSSKPFISGDTFRNYANHVFDESTTFNPNNVKQNDIVFLSGDLVGLYFNYFHPKINSEYILITHNSKSSIGKKDLQKADKNIIHWFASNLEINQGKKISIIPKGLENLRRLKYGKKIWYKSNNISKTEMILLYNFDDEHLKKTSDFLNLSKTLEFKIFKEPKDYFYNLKKTKFFIVPDTKELDQFRIWEGLLLNSFPIMVNSSFSNNLKNIGVPGIYLNNLEEILNFKHDELDKIYENELMKNYSDLTKFNYWMKRIESYKVI